MADDRRKLSWKSALINLPICCVIKAVRNEIESLSRQV